MITKKPSGYWKNWDHVETELSKLITQFGHFPTQDELSKSGNQPVNCALRYHGGLDYARRKLGFEDRKVKPRNYWRDFNNVKNEIERVIERLRHFPNKSEINIPEFFTLVLAIEKYHGGFPKVREAMGYEKIGKKTNSYWQDFNNVEKKLREIIRDINHFPTLNELRRTRNLGLADAIANYHGGFQKVRQRLGYKLIKKEYGYWKRWKNVRSELEKVIETIGHFPTNNELMKLGHSALRSAIGDYYGGLGRVRRRVSHRKHKVKTTGEFISFLQKDETARNLSAAAVILDGNGYDIEQVIVDIYSGKFKDQRSLHELLQQSTNEIYDLIRDGITNLGYFIGGFSLQNRNIIPVLLGQSIEAIPQDKVSTSLESRLVRILRGSYSPGFNQNPQEVIDELKEKVDSSQGKKQNLYQKLYDYYKNILELGDELS